jgi:hypothetical protein
VWSDDVDRVDVEVCGCYVTVDGRGVEAAGGNRRGGELELVVDKSVWLYRNNEIVERLSLCQNLQNNNVMVVHTCSSRKARTSVALLRLCWFACAIFLPTCVRNRTPAGCSISQ